MIATIIGFFVCAFLISLAVTPFISRFAIRYNLVDMPNARKIHFEPIPRIGGLAIFCSFIFAFFPIVIFRPDLIEYIINEPRLGFLSIGAILAFLLGFVDDVKGLPAKYKLFIQILIASTIYFGGLKINTIGPFSLAYVFNGWLSFPLTITWVIVVINAINLIDGLDGLAAGVSFFVCIVLTISSVNTGIPFLAFILACLAGSILGFLRYNFNPASIFMGDCGAYFLGYMLAASSMLGSFNRQTAVSILIPIIAMGLPLMDVIWATLRRFIVGKDIFKADNSHIHHRLINIGFSQKRAVLILYGLTLLMGALSVILLYMSAGNAVLLLIVFAFTLFLIIRKLGLIDFRGNYQVSTWLYDILDEIGITHGRRKFFGHQVKITESESIEELWLATIDAFRMVKIEYVEMELFGETHANKQSIFSWNYKTESDVHSILYAEDKLYIRFPIEHNNINMGVLVINKDMFDPPHISERTFRRLDQLRKTISYALYDIITR